MKTVKLIVGLAAPILIAWVVRSKVRSEHVTHAPILATYTKLAYKPIVKWAANRVLKGRNLDRTDPHQGRFTEFDVNRILDRTWHTYYIHARRVLTAALHPAAIAPGNVLLAAAGSPLAALNLFLSVTNVTPFYMMRHSAHNRSS